MAVHMPPTAGRTRRAAVVISGAAVVVAAIAVVVSSSGQTVLASAVAWGMPALPGPYVSAYPAGAYGAYGRPGSAYPAGAYGAYGYAQQGYTAAGVVGAGGVAGAGVVLPPSYAAANYGVASGLAGGPTLPLASVVARNAERVAANSDALLRLYQHANAGLFATNQMLLHLQNEVQAAEGTWSTVPMEFPAAYGATAGGMVAGGLVAATPGVPASTITTTSSSGGTSTTVTSTSVATSQGKLKNALSADAAASGMASAIKATASSPVAAKAAVKKAVSSASAPPGFHLAWVPNQGAVAQSATAVQAGSAWNWRPLAQASLQSSVYKTEGTYPYISGPYHAGAVRAAAVVSPYQQSASSPFRPL